MLAVDFYTCIQSVIKTHLNGFNIQTRKAILIHLILISIHFLKETPGKCQISTWFYVYGGQFACIFHPDNLVHPFMLMPGQPIDQTKYMAFLKSAQWEKYLWK